MEVRKATKDDLPRLAELFDGYRVWYRQASDLEGAKTFLEERMDLNESVILLIEDDKNMYGFVQLYPIFSSVRLKRMYLLNDLYIDASQRGRGLGKRLIHSAKAECQRIKGAGLMLETETNNVIGNKLYIKEGFHLEENNFYFWPCPQ